MDRTANLIRDLVARTRAKLADQRGQVLPIFAIMAVVLLGGAAVLTDAAWWWVNQQRMQRAADAGALAGAIHLPGNQALAFNRARAEVAKNGFVHGVDGMIVSPRRDPGDPRKLVVDIAGPVGTNFAKVFCWDGGPCMDSVDVGVTGAASFVLPVPMGSPQNYYGVGFLRDVVTTTNSSSGDTGWNSPDRIVNGGQWTNPGNAFSGGDTTETTDGHTQEWWDFDFLNEIPSSATITGLQVRTRFVELDGNQNAPDCRIDVRVSWDDGASWSDVLQTGRITTNDQDFYMGSSSTTADWGSHTWTRDDLSNNNFRVRLVWHDGGPDCPVNRGVRVGEIEAQADYSYTTTSTSVEVVDVNDPNGVVLDPHGFWGALQSQGAPNIQGDAYMTYYDTRTSSSNDDYSPDSYYQYGIEFPAGSSSGEVWLFDPGFCHVDSDKGTGEYYTFGSPNGTSDYNAVSTFYDLWDTRNTPYDTTDDILVYGSGTDYRRLRLHDPQLDLDNTLSNTSDCDGLAWHNDWVRIANNLAGDRTYRLHTYSTDPGSANDQRSSTGLNAFAIWADASGGTPRVHGLGAMEAYVRLPGGQATEFYLAQIDAEHAGKTMVIKLWDPGDTGNLAANLQILRPTTTSYQPTNFNYSAEENSGNASNCNSRSGTNVNSVTTNTGGSSRYNGCWLTIEIPLPVTYDAPHPSSDTVTNEGGWWKIRYNMSGSTNDYSTDLTTWEVTLRGNPVHLVPTG